jgi:hypothetical protein
MSLMRLLQRKPDGEIVFHERTSGDLPTYAILSYTWGKEEVIFQDIQDGVNMSKTVNKAGWRKIQFCANQAAADGTSRRLCRVFLWFGRTLLALPTAFSLAFSCLGRVFYETLRSSFLKVLIQAVETDSNS